MWRIFCSDIIFLVTRRTGFRPKSLVKHDFFEMWKMGKNGVFFSNLPRKPIFIFCIIKVRLQAVISQMVWHNKLLPQKLIYHFGEKWCDECGEWFAPIFLRFSPQNWYFCIFIFCQLFTQFPNFLSKLFEKFFKNFPKKDFSTHLKFFLHQNFSKLFEKFFYCFRGFFGFRLLFLQNLRHFETIFHFQKILEIVEFFWYKREHIAALLQEFPSESHPDLMHIQKLNFAPSAQKSFFSAKTRAKISFQNTFLEDFFWLFHEIFHHQKYGKYTIFAFFQDFQ